ncbi:MAG TPA: HupE/UreJ family protein [Candidatus Saccharimonadia bacterium]|nr:HupE/UreJ family protein [Candidatus Saccharimonadia bacterium]
MLKPKAVAAALQSVVVLAALALPAVAAAHPVNYNAIQTVLYVQGSQISLHTDISASIISALNKQNPDPSAELSYFQAYVARGLTISQNGQACPFTLTAINTAPSINTLDGNFVCSTPVTVPTQLQIHSQVFVEHSDTANHFVTVGLAGQQWQLVFTPQHQDYPGDVAAQHYTPAAPTAAATATRFSAVAGQFIGLGILHILTGYDHILFLVSIVLLLRSWKRILVLLTTFTVAHSITLILAGLHIVALSPRLVEPLIALSIVYMALRDAAVLRWRWPDRPLPRLAATGGFGLIHGLGFAGAITQANIPAAYLVPSLLFFNVGVELGQLCVMAVVLPLLFLVDTLSGRRRWLFGASLAIAALAAIWFVQRL